VETGRFVTMADVAVSARASTRDVALVVAADARVAADLRHRIANVIQTSGYRPLKAIQGRLGRPLRLAIVLKTFRGDDPEANRFYAPVVSAIAQSCLKYGTKIVEARMIVDDHYGMLEVPAALTDGSCDAAFLVGAQVGGLVIEQSRAACPIVLVDGYSVGDRLDSVVTDNVAGAAMALEHLIEAGHREIALLGTEPVCYPSMQGRRTGYMATLEARGMRTHFMDTGYVLGEAVAILGVDYVKRHPSVTAVFGANDAIVVHFLQLVRDAGYRVPDEMSLVGFDDIDLASLVMPTLTTLAIDKRLMGRAGFALLAHRLEVHAAEPVHIVLMPSLIQRESVAPPNPR